MRRTMRAIRVRREHPGPAGFTLIEVLVATAVMVLMLAMFLQMSNSAVSAYRQGRANLDNYATGRALLDALTRDIQCSVIRNDLPSFPMEDGNRSFAFYTALPGIPNDNAGEPLRNLSYIKYSLVADGERSSLLRSNTEIAWTANGSQKVRVGIPLQAPPDVAPRVLADGIVGFDYRFLLRDGTIAQNPESVSQIAAVRVTIATADGASLDTLRDQQKLDPLCKDLRESLSAQPATLSAKSLWEDLMNDPSFTAKYPSRALTGIRFFERVVSLPSNSGNSGSSNRSL